MISTNPAADLIVIGGGVIGLAAAREVARAGMAVTVFDQGDFGSGATCAAAGMLSPLGEATSGGDFFEFGLHSLRMYEAWVRQLEEESGIRVEFRKSGKIRMAFSAEEVSDLRQRAKLGEEFGMGIRWLEGGELRAEAPGIMAHPDAALLIEEDFRVDNRSLARALVKAAAGSGVNLQPRRKVSEVMHDRDRVTGVMLDDGSFQPSNRILLAAGAWSGSIGGLPRPPKVRPIRGQMLALRLNRALSPRVIETDEVYLVPRDDGRVLIGATVEEAGFTTGTTGGGIRTLLNAAAKLAPTLDDAQLVEVWSGFRPGSEDGFPILGPDPVTEGLLLATGHYRNGILLAPATAELIASYATGRNTMRSLFPDAFAPARSGAAP
jgi:glycine oxidase